MDEIINLVSHEYDLHKLLAGRRCGHILDVRAASFRMRDQAPQLGYIYMDFAPFGDLFSLNESTAFSGYLPG